MYWKELYAEPGSSRLGLLGYGLLAVIFIAVCGFTIYIFLESMGHILTCGAGEYFCAYAIGMSTFLCCCGLLLLTARAAGSITSEKERDCWVSLIGTPLEAGQIVKAKILGSLWSLRGLRAVPGRRLAAGLAAAAFLFLGYRFLAAGPGDPGGVYGHAGRLLLAGFQEHAPRHGRRAGHRHRGRRRLSAVLLPAWRSSARTGAETTE